MIQVESVSSVKQIHSEVLTQETEQHLCESIIFHSHFFSFFILHTNLSTLAVKKKKLTVSLDHFSFQLGMWRTSFNMHYGPTVCFKTINLFLDFSLIHAQA